MTVARSAGPIVDHAEHLPAPPGGTDSMRMPLTGRRFTVEEYHRMWRAGVFTEDDRDVKIPPYAAAGFPEVWLVNLPADAVARYRDQGPQGYATVGTAGRGEMLTPLKLPGLTLRVDDILG